jgi:hypothetical protein
MTDILALLLRFDWVSFALFSGAVACLCFVGWVGAQFSEEITAEDAITPPIPPIVPENQYRRKHDREDC